MIAYRVKAWIVKTVAGIESLFLDYARAVQYAGRTHGTITELYVKEES